MNPPKNETHFTISSNLNLWACPLPYLNPFNQLLFQLGFNGPAALIADQSQLRQHWIQKAFGSVPIRVLLLNIPGPNTKIYRHYPGLRFNEILVPSIADPNFKLSKRPFPNKTLNFDATKS